MMQNYSCQFKLYTQQMLGQGSSLQEHLAISIRRAKEKIFNNALSFSSHPYDNVQEQEEYRQTIISQSDPRIRSISQKITNNQNKEDKSVLATAMKILQEKIMTLERENQELRDQHQQTHAVNTLQKGKQDDYHKEFIKVKEQLIDKENYIKKINRENHDLIEENKALHEKIDCLEEELKRLLNRDKQELKDHHFEIDEKSKAIKLQNELIIQKLQKETRQLSEVKKILTESNLELQQRNHCNHQTISKLSKQLDQERKINLRWMKIHDSQFNDHKQNTSFQANVQHSHKKQTPHKNNKELHEIIERSKVKIASITRECKQYQERYNKIKLIAEEIVENVNKTIINPNSHIKFLAMRLHKLDNQHLDVIRNCSRVRKSRLHEGSGSKQRKRKSLKMSDLNSNSKRERSVSGSRRKTRLEPDSITKSQKKKVNIEGMSEIARLQKQVQELKRIYRNLIAHSKEGQEKPELAIQISEVSQEYTTKYNKLLELRGQKG